MVTPASATMSIGKQTRQSGYGRPPVATDDRFMDAGRDDSGPAVRQLWSEPSDRYGSVSDSRARDLTAGKLTTKLSHRTADVRGRQLSTHCGFSRARVR
jgi:hypothetical protein